MMDANSVEAIQRIAVPIASPSPPVGEGITAGRSGLAWVRGLPVAIPTLRQPLTRLRFAEPPSPPRREGKFLASQSDRSQ
jgi:hypothetical protein